MKEFLQVIPFVLILFAQVESTFFPYVYPRLKLETRFHDAGDPLILTPYLKEGSISLAQNLSRVSLTDKIGFPSYSGFFTVDARYNSNHFFWYFPPFSANSSAPILLWLQGGPGGSSLFGLFSELGPLIAKKDGFSLRKYHWALNYHLIFIDNPVGTGFSYTKDDEGYCSDQDCVGKGLYNSMQQFLTLFPDLRNNEFYITGESYAGKYIPALGMEIHRQNSRGNKIINLKGMAIGNGYCDPIHQMDYGNYLYQHGLIDDNQYELFQELELKIIDEIKKENWARADILMDGLMEGELHNYSYIQNFTGFNYYYNFLKTQNDEDFSIFAKLLDNDMMRRSIHVGGLPFNDGVNVQIHLALDILKSIAPYITELLSHYRMLFYNGQLDIVVAYPLTENFLQNLKFSSAEQYKTAPRYIWKVDKDIAGYVKKAGNLTEILIRNSGHLVPHDQPKWAYTMITRFVKNKF